MNRLTGCAVDAAAFDDERRRPRNDSIMRAGAAVACTHVRDLRAFRDLDVSPLPPFFYLFSNASGGGSFIRLRIHMWRPLRGKRSPVARDDSFKSVFTCSVM